MPTKEMYDGVIKGFCFGLSGVSAITGIIASAGLIPSMTLLHGTNLLVSSIVFYNIPAVLDRIENFFAPVKPKTLDLDIIFSSKNTAPHGIGGDHFKPSKKKRALVKKMAIRKK